MRKSHGLVYGGALNMEMDDSEYLWLRLLIVVDR